MSNVLAGLSRSASTHLLQYPTPSAATFNLPPMLQTMPLRSRLADRPKTETKEKRGSRMLLGRCTALLMQPGVRLLFASFPPSLSLLHLLWLCSSIFRACIVRWLLYSTVRAPTTRFAGIPSPQACCPSPRKGQGVSIFSTDIIHPYMAFFAGH